MSASTTHTMNEGVADFFATEWNSDDFGVGMFCLFSSAGEADTLAWIGIIRALPPDQKDAVLKNIVAQALGHDSDLHLLMATTMLMPRRADLHLGLGFAYLIRGRYAAAHKSFCRALVLDASPIAQLGCGVALQCLDQPTQATEFLLRALEGGKDGVIGRTAAVSLRTLLDDVEQLLGQSPTKAIETEQVPYFFGNVPGIIMD